MDNVSNMPLFAQRPYRFPIHVNSYDYRAICLFFACILYGLVGVPTPDSLSKVEMLIGLLLILSIGIGNMYDAIIQPFAARKRRFWKSGGQVFLLYGLSIPVIVGALSGADIAAMIRDIAPFLFLFMPLFLLPTIRARPYYFRSIVFAIIFIGLMFSLRSLLMRYGLMCLGCRDELLYLENMPTVLFSCLLLIGGAIHHMAQRISIKNMMVAGVLLALSVLPIAAMAVTLQRASLGAVILYVLMLCAYHLYRHPYRAIMVGGMCLSVFAFLMAFGSVILSAVFALLWDKTDKVGLNMRPQEFMAVWNVVTHTPLTFLFGIGWGGYFASPAVGGLMVNFTHNFFTSILLKSGFIGVMCCIAYILGLLERLARVVIRNPAFGLALCAPILIDLTLYASFKSLDFGLMLLLISGSLVYFRQAESSPTPNRKNCE